MREKKSVKKSYPDNWTISLMVVRALALASGLTRLNLLARALLEPPSRGAEHVIHWVLYIFEHDIAIFPDSYSKKGVLLKMSD